VLKKILRHPFEALKVTAVWTMAAALVWLATPTRASLAAGLPLVAAGLAVRAWAAGHLQRNRRLATSGPYAYLRDPLYLGRLLLLVGFGVIAANAAGWVLCAAGLAVFFIDYMPRKLRKETARLEKHFGAPYVDYRRRVHSLVPRLRPYPERSGDRWRADLFWRENREYWLILAVALMVGLMVIRSKALS